MSNTEIHSGGTPIEVEEASKFRLSSVASFYKLYPNALHKPVDADHETIRQTRVLKVCGKHWHVWASVLALAVSNFDLFHFCLLFWNVRTVVEVLEMAENQ